MHETEQKANVQLTTPLEEANITYLPATPESEIWPNFSIEGTKTTIGTGRFSEIADLVNIDGRGLGHITYSHKPEITDSQKLESYNAVTGRNGKVISNYQMGVIAANQYFIRWWLPERHHEFESPSQEVQPPVETWSQPVLSSDPGDAIVTNHSLPAELDLSFMRNFPEPLAIKVAFALNDWATLVAERERSSITLGATSAKYVRTAQRRYERLRRESQSWTAKKIKELGLAESDELEILRWEELNEARIAALSIKKDFDKLSQPTGKLSKQRQQFYDWWARQGGGDKFFSRQRLTGTAKKMTVMFAVGLPFGVAAGTAGIFIGGPILGAVAAAGVSRGVARNLIRGHVNKNANAKTVSELQYEKRLTDQTAKIDSHYKLNQAEPIRLAKVKTVTDIYAEGTARSVRRNRLRLMGSVATGAAFGLFGTFLGELAHQALVGTIKSHSVAKPHVTIPVKPEIQPNPNTSHIPVKTPSPSKIKPPVISRPKPSSHHQLPPRTNHHLTRPTVPPPIKPIVAPHPHLTLHGATGKEFYVKPGGGEISEIQAYASSHNYSITPASADRIYLELYAQHGSNIIKLDGNGPSTYLIAPGDIGLSHPGLAHWYPGIEGELRELLAKDAA